MVGFLEHHCGQRFAAHVIKHEEILLGDIDERMLNVEGKLYGLGGLEYEDVTYPGNYAQPEPSDVKLSKANENCGGYRRNVKTSQSSWTSTGTNSRRYARFLQRSFVSYSTSGMPTDFSSKQQLMCLRMFLQAFVSPGRTSHWAHPSYGPRF